MSDSGRVGLLLVGIFSAGAIHSAFLPLWFGDRGLTAAEIGSVLGIATILRVVGVPGGGWLADRLGRRTVLVAAGALACTAAALLPGLHAVAPLLVVTAALGMASALLGPLTDAVTLALAAERRLEYGRTRVWGSVAYMLATAGAGWLLARTGTSLVPVLVAAGYGLAAFGALWLPSAQAAPRQAVESASPFRQPAFRWALLATTLIQGSHAAYYGFAPLYWRAAGMTDTAIGLLIAEGIIAEIALFIWGGALVRRLGPARLTAIAAIACLLRWTGFALVTRWPALAILQFLHAATFACQHLSTMQVLQRMPAARAGMAQTVMSAIGFSGATGVLIWVAGQLYRPWGGGIFLLMAGIGGTALLTVRPLRRCVPALPG